LVAVFMVLTLLFYETRSSYPCALLSELEKALFALFVIVSVNLGVMLPFFR
jgi:hypothetical protein